MSWRAGRALTETSIYKPSYYVSRVDKSPFQTKSLAFPLASVYFAMNSPSSASTSIPIQSLYRLTARGDSRVCNALVFDHTSNIDAASFTCRRSGTLSRSMPLVYRRISGGILRYGEGFFHGCSLSA